MRSMTCAVALLLAAGVAAQEGGKPPASPARAAYDQLVAEQKQAMSEYQAAVKKITATEEYKKAVDAKDRAATSELLKAAKRPDNAAYVEQAMQLAGKYKGDDQVQFYAFALQSGADKETAATAAQAILDKHVKSKQLLGLVEAAYGIQRALGNEEGAKFLAAIAKDNPDPEIRAYAIYWPAYMALRNKSISDADRAAAEASLKEARKLAEGTLLADRIDAPKFQAEHLQIGMEAPDIVGEDVDGVPFKLSDYRGKVVVVDFWGFW